MLILTLQFVVSKYHLHTGQEFPLLITEELAEILVRIFHVHTDPNHGLYCNIAPLRINK